MGIPEKKRETKEIFETIIISSNFRHQTTDPRNLQVKHQAGEMPKKYIPSYINFKLQIMAVKEKHCKRSQRKEP